MFNNKGSFFLDLGSEGARPAQVAIAPEQPAPKAQEAAAQPLMVGGGQPAASTPAAPAEPSAVAGASTLTTAEAIAAELRPAWPPLRRSV